MSAFPLGAAFRVFRWQILRMLRGGSPGIGTFVLRQLFWPCLALATSLLAYAPFVEGGIREIIEAHPQFTDGLGLGTWLLAGILVLALFLEYINIGATFAGERDYGTLTILSLSPAPRCLWLWGSAAAGIPAGLAGIGVFAILAALVLAAIPPHPGLFFAAFVYMLVWSLPWGALVVNIFAAGRNMRLLYALFETPAEFLAGTRFPVRALPTAVLGLALWYPLTHATIFMRLAVAKTPDFFRLGREAVAIAFLGLIYGVAAFVVSSFAERRERREGNEDRS